MGLIRDFPSDQRFPPPGFTSTTWTASAWIHGQLELSSAEILALNTTPQTLIAAPGENKVVIINPYTAIAFLDYNSATYAAGANKLMIAYSGAGDLCSFTNAFIEATADKYEMSAIEAYTLSVDTALEVYVENADPTNGNSPIYIDYWYIEIDYSVNR